MNIQNYINNPEKINKDNILVLYNELTNGTGSDSFVRVLEGFRQGIPYTGHWRDICHCADKARDSYNSTRNVNPGFDPSETRRALIILRGKAVSISESLVEKLR